MKENTYKVSKKDNIPATESITYTYSGFTKLFLLTV